MAVIDSTKVRNLVDTETVSWDSLTASDTGEPYEFAKFSDKTVQVFGTFGGTVTLQGSNDPRVLSDPNNAVWATLTDVQASALTFTAAGIGTVAENPRFIRPSVGTGVTSVTISLQAAGV